ncbi:MAG: DUF1883 domain-containing protein [Spirochaetales bacterium]|nr:DUF1883 domain-containing protein [Spirochaetales bacterium]
MTPHLHRKLNLKNGHVVKANIKGSAMVMLMDDSSYEKYTDGEDFDYFGKKAGVKPVLLKPPFPGEWHVVIEQTNPAKDIFVNIQIIGE